MTASEILFRSMTGSDRELEDFAKCFVRNGTDRGLAALDWQYRRNPSNKMFVELAISGGQLAAIYATLPLIVRIDNERRLAVQSLDTLTDASFRGRGLFGTLANATFERASTSGAEYVYGFPNRNSAPGFFGKLGWSSLDPVPFLIRPLRTAYSARMALRRPAVAVPNWPLVFHAPPLPPHLRGERVEAFDQRFDRLWHSFYAMGTRIAVDRDARYLNWRLAEKPGEEYRSLAAFAKDEPVALVSHCVKAKHAGRVGYVMELLFAPGYARAARILLRQTLMGMRRDGADVALAWCFPHSASFTAYVRCGFLPFPERLRPVELHMGVRGLAKPTAAFARRRDWYISYLDSDTV